MISVLLVEDNKLALEYLETLIDWERHGFKVVATALNGKDGLNKYLALKPQLIITDIQMPSVSGVDMAKRIRETGASVKIIFLTSYQVFSYARSALDLGVSEYILKHELNEQTLIKKLAGIKDLIEILSDDKSDQYSPHVKSAVRFIASDYKNVALSVERIAGRVGMNADWLGTIFKRDTGYSIREYLNIYRIKKSKELIDEGFKIQEVYKEVGYMTYQYFGKVFRKITGLTPVEYRGKK